MTELPNAPIPARAPDAPSRVGARVECDGYAIVSDLFDAATCARLVQQVDEIEREHAIPFGQNDFEGFRTRRIFNLIARGPLFRALVVDETLLSLVEAILGEGFLLSGTTSMHIGPGETDQLLHPDDGMVTLPRPHSATMVTVLCALSDFRAENGGTRLIPRSHRDPAIIPSPESQTKAIRAEMPAGSILVLNASTFHGGGANTTADEHRYGLSIQFVAGWCRQQQNLMLGTPRELVATYPRRLQELIGYSIFRGVMGHVNREHPLRLLGTDVETKMVWDEIGPGEGDD
ncbi:MAG TPA: phytanoyl-CoA dioxygenase family protein [Myxococcota bacterium]|nr:phytanoyl-CoA dioxygenase family protein [Myxococcota bacterium]